MNGNTYSSSVAGGPVKIFECLQWEDRQVVSDEELATYRELLRTYPEMVDENYQTHEEVCLEYGDEVIGQYMPMPNWLDDSRTPLLDMIAKQP